MGRWHRADVGADWAPVRKAKQMEKMIKKLTARERAMVAKYLQWWQDAAVFAKPGDTVTEYGLCYAVRYAEDPAIRAEWARMQDLMAMLFDGDEFPFGESDYWKRHEAGTQHLSPARRAWVANTLTLLEKIQ